MFPHPAAEVILPSSKSVVAGQCIFLEPKETQSATSFKINICQCVQGVSTEPTEQGLT